MIKFLFVVSVSLGGRRLQSFCVTGSVEEERTMAGGGFVRLTLFDGECSRFDSVRLKYWMAG